jgi:putative selenate reductase FAD-binding subunit
MISGIVRPKTVAEAVKAQSSPGAAFLGGGTWLNSGKAGNVTTLVSLEKLGLNSIRPAQGRCLIGASITFQSLVDSPHVPGALRDAARLTASRTLRNMVTVGGEIGLAPVDSAVIPVLLVLGAELSVAGKRKSISMETWLEQGRAGLVVGVSVPAPAVAAVRAVSRTSHSPRSLVAAVSVRAAGSTLESPRIVVSDCLGQRVRLPDLERKLDGSPLPPREEMERITRAEFSPGSDMHASASYKRYMAGVLVSDMLAALFRESAR